MQIEHPVQSFVPQADSPEKIYELFLSLGYPKDKVLNPSYRRKIEEFEFPKEEKEKIKDIYTVFNYDGKLLSLKSEKEKYYNNDPTAKFKTDKGLLQEELRIFGEILDDKIITLQKEIQTLEGKKREIQYEMFQDLKKEKPEQKILFEKEIKQKENEIEYLRDTKRRIHTPEQKPFVWDIDFAEIFGDKGGFDIVIGNPPYIRQEKITPPNKLKAEVTLEDKRGYKEKLLRSIQVHYPFIKKLDKKSDYYIYFYFHGLSLLSVCL